MPYHDEIPLLRLHPGQHLPSLLGVMTKTKSKTYKSVKPEAGSSQLQNNTTKTVPTVNAQMWRPYAFLNPENIRDMFYNLGTYGILTGHIRERTRRTPWGV